MKTFKELTVSDFVASTTGYEHGIDPANWDVAYVQHLVEYAVGVKLTRCTAGKTKDHTTEELAEIRDKLIKDVVNGLIPAGGGKRLSNEDKTLKDVVLTINGFNSKKGVTKSAGLDTLLGLLSNWIKTTHKKDLTEEQVITWLKTFDAYDSILDSYNNPKTIDIDNLPSF